MAAATTNAPSNRDAEIRVYSYYRDAELRGSNLLYRLLRVLKDGESQISLSEHLADETRHAILAWRVLAWALERDPSLGPKVARLISGLDRGVAEPVVVQVQAHRFVSPTRRRNNARRIVPGWVIFGIRPIVMK